MSDTKYPKLFYEALRIRLVEEKIIELYPSDKIQSPVHLSIGQEAVAVGVCENLKVDDWMFINNRGHAYYLAKGGPLPEFFAELFGKRTGLCKGKAGSMHVAAPQCGIMGASAVVASTISHAVGAALASKIRGENRVFVAVFGDGATEQGVYHESLNFAALHELPVLFLCENNGLAVHAAIPERQSYSITDHARVYGIQSLCVEEGYDFMKISEASSEVVSNIRKTNKPVVLEVKTCRYKEHVGPGEDFLAGYRSVDEVNLWKSKDPLVTDHELIRKFTPIIRSEIDGAIRFAEESPFPQLCDLLTDVM